MNKLKSLNSTTKNNFITYGILLGMFLFAQIMTATGNISSLFRGLLVPLCIYAIMAVSLNLVVGVLGDLSLGHAGFMCIGAYAGAFFSVLTEDSFSQDWLRFLIAIVIGGVVAGVFGLIIGIPVLRLKGDYLAIVTLAFGEIIKNVVNLLYVGKDSNGLHFSITSQTDLNLEPTGEVLVKGAQGITGTPKDSNFIVAFVILFLVVIVALNLINSRTGRAVMSIRDNRIAAQSIGINITKYKLVIFVISALMAGIAGVLYGHNLNNLAATSKNFGYNMSIMILVYVVLGGIGSIRGSIIATVILYALPEILREVGDYRMLFYAILLVFMMIVNNNEKFKDLTTNIKNKIKLPKKAVKQGGSN